MTIKDTLNKFPNIEIDILLSAVLNKPREFLFMNPSFKLTRIQENRLTQMARRRLKGEPIAYILGYKDFYGLKFKVNKNVLIPRPETEELVNTVLKVCSNFAKASLDKKVHKVYAKKPLRILDIGTGSGCIAISIAKRLKEFPSASWRTNSEYQITASDISKKALVVARANAKYHKVNIKLRHSDLLPPSPRLRRTSENVGMSCDIIIANLPYGWNAWKNKTSSETVGLKFEPKTALFTEENGLYLIKKLLYQIAEKKQKPKYIFLEFDPRQKKHLQKIIKKILSDSRIKFYKDFNNWWRYVEIQL